MIWLGHGVMKLRGAARRHWWLRWLKWTVIPLWQGLCFRLTGHVPSPHERGYGGGKFLDVWCEYCDAFLQIPAKEMPQALPIQLWNEAVGEDSKENRP